MIKNWKNDTSFKGDFDTWLDGELKTVIEKNYYYAVCQIGDTPWRIVIEGPEMDFKGTLSKVIIILAPLSSF